MAAALGEAVAAAGVHLANRVAQEDGQLLVRPAVATLEKRDEDWCLGLRGGCRVFGVLLAQHLADGVARYAGSRADVVRVRLA